MNVSAKKRDKTQNIRLQRPQSTFWVQDAKNGTSFNCNMHAVKTNDALNEKDGVTEPEHPSSISPRSVSYPDSGNIESGTNPHRRCQTCRSMTLVKNRLLQFFCTSTGTSGTENVTSQLKETNFEDHLSALNIVNDSDRNMEDSEDTNEDTSIQNGDEKEELMDENDPKEKQLIANGVKAEEQPFRAFVVMNEKKQKFVNGSTSSTASSKVEKVILEVERKGEHSESVEQKSKAIVVGQITNTLCPKPESSPLAQSENEVSSYNLSSCVSPTASYANMRFRCYVYRLLLSSCITNGESLHFCICIDCLQKHY